jgi:hypothetical protein
MPRKIKALLMLGAVAAISYSIFYLMSYLTIRSLDSYFAKEMIELNISELRHDEGDLRILLEGDFETSLELAKHRYFTRALLMAELAAKQENFKYDSYLKDRLTEAKDLARELSYKFPDKKMENTWEALTK